MIHKLLHWLFLFAAISLPLLVPGLIGYGYWRGQVFDDGFERGVLYGARYYDCFGVLPTRTVRDRLAHIVNDPRQMPCKWLSIYGDDLLAKPKAGK